MGVIGIDGVFFRARDPASLAIWHRETLGIAADEHGMWRQQPGPTVFAPFAADTDYFPADRQWMLNPHVADLDGLIATLKTHGVAAETRAEWEAPGFGRFARIHDPEGNPIELWEPSA